MSVFLGTDIPEGDTQTSHRQGSIVVVLVTYLVSARITKAVIPPNKLPR